MMSNSPPPWRNTNANQGARPWGACIVHRDEQGEPTLSIQREGEAPLQLRLRAVDSYVTILNPPTGHAALPPSLDILLGRPIPQRDFLITLRGAQSDAIASTPNVLTQLWDAVAPPTLSSIDKDAARWCSGTYADELLADWEMATHVSPEEHLERCEAATRIRGLGKKYNLDLGGFTSLTALPPALFVGGSLWLNGCTALTTLPIGLTVGRDLDLRGCIALTESPLALTVGRNIYWPGGTALPGGPPEPEDDFVVVTQGVDF